MNAGRYQLDNVLGVGSFATVYRATDAQLDDDVVVKVLAENHSLNPEIRERFIGEGRSLRKVSSEHVVTVHDIGESDQQQPYLVLELADRGTLAQRVQSLQAQAVRLDTDDVLSLVRPLTAALEAVHDAQLVHRDLSPGNLLIASRTVGHDEGVNASRLVAPDERLLLADLGMCKDLAINSGLTVSGGTAGFRPPEQSQPGMVDTRADIWAASALLDWVTEGSELPDAFHDVLQQGMHMDPAARQQTVSQWRAEIEEALVPAPEPEPATPAPPPSADDFRTVMDDHLPTPPARNQPRMTMAAITGAVLLAAGLLLGLLLGSDRPESAVDGAAIDISGPEEVAVGEAATFTAETEGLNSWVWSLPTGTHVVDDPETTITATEPGSTEIILRARGPQGEELEVRHHITVTP